MWAITILIHRILFTFSLSLWAPKCFILIKSDWSIFFCCLCFRYQNDDFLKILLPPHGFKYTWRASVYYSHCPYDVCLIPTMSPIWPVRTSVASWLLSPSDVTLSLALSGVTRCSSLSWYVSCPRPVLQLRCHCSWPFQGTKQGNAYTHIRHTRHTRSLFPFRTTAFDQT